MLIPFQCPHCGMSKKVMSEYAGQSGPCASCGRMVTIPLPATTAVAATTATTAAAVPATRSGSRLLFILIMSLAGIGLIGFLLFFGVIIFFLRGSPTFNARAVMQQNQCQNNLRQIALALRNYHDVHQSFPPVYTTDADGKPLHSWRTLILPFLGHQQLYARIALDEPWDSPRNKPLGDFLPQFHCAAESGPPTGITSYVGVTGAGTIWDPAQPTRIADITDGTSNTIIVVEVQGSRIHWMEPRDLDLETFVAQGGQSNHVDFGRIDAKRNSASTYQAAFADGSVAADDNSDAPPTRRAKATRNGGEVVKTP